MDGIQCILDGNSFRVASRDFQSQWEVQVNLLDGWIDKVHFQDVFVFDRRRGGVESPGMKSMDDSKENQYITNPDVMAYLKSVPSRLLRFDGKHQLNLLSLW